MPSTNTSRATAKIACRRRAGRSAHSGAARLYGPLRVGCAGRIGFGGLASVGSAHPPRQGIAPAPSLASRSGGAVRRRGPAAGAGDRIAEAFPVSKAPGGRLDARLGFAPDFHDLNANKNARSGIFGRRLLRLRFEFNLGRHLRGEGHFHRSRRGRFCPYVEEEILRAALCLQAD